MRSKISKIIMTLSLVFCMAISMFAVRVRAEDTISTSKIDNCESVVQAYDAETAAEYLNGENTYPKLYGYLFSGWYTDKACDENGMLNGEEPTGTVYALFVPEHVLSVKAQVSSHLIDDSVTENDKKASIRFVTTVDSLLYQQVGFEISYVGSDGNIKTATSASNKVYQSLYVTGSTTDVWKVTPQGSFCGLSTYFKACTVTGVPTDNYSTKFTVKPYWITMDGDKVYGVESIKTIEDGCLRDNVYVSSTGQDIPYYGTSTNPYATLDYAIAHVNNGKTVHIIDTLTVASNATWTAHGKNVTITGGTLDFSALSDLCINDGVTFSALNLKLSNNVYAEGNDLIVASDVTLTNDANTVTVYGGSKSSDVANTNIELYAGSYLLVYGGGYDTNVTGDTNVIIGAGVNSAIDHTDHEHTYMLFGGCTRGTVYGNTNITIKENAEFNYIYGAGHGSASRVNGSTNIDFAGKAMSIYGGGFYGTNADTHVKVTGGEVYQIFGGCEVNSMEGNTDIQVLGGTVVRRIYGGCYNNDTSTSNQVKGHTNVLIGPKAYISFAYLTDTNLCSISRYGAYDNECGTFIFNEESDYLEKTGGFLTTSSAYHYRVITNGNNADDSYGNVSSAGDWIHIVPKENYVATVTIGGVVKHYTEGESYYPLPTLTDKTSKTDIVVEFSETKQTDIVGEPKLAFVSVADSENGTVTSSSKYCIAGETVTLTVTPNEGYNLIGLTVMKDGTEVTLSDAVVSTGGEYSFKTEEGNYTVEATFAQKEYGAIGGTIGGVTGGSITATETTTGEVYTFEDALYADGSYGISLPVGTYKLYFDCADTEGLIPTVTVSNDTVTEQNLEKVYQKLGKSNIGTDGTAEWVLTDNGRYEVQTSNEAVDTVSMGYFETVENFDTTEFVIHTQVEHVASTNVLSGLAISGTLGDKTETAVFGFVNNSGNAVVHGLNQWIGIQTVENNANKMSYQLSIVKKDDTITCFIDQVQCAQWNLNAIDNNSFGGMTNVKVGIGIYRLFDVAFSNYTYSTVATEVDKTLGKTVTYENLPTGVTVSVGNKTIASGITVLGGAEVTVNGLTAEQTIYEVTVNEQPITVENGKTTFTLDENAIIKVIEKYSVSGTVGGVTSGTIIATETTSKEVFTFTDVLKEDGSYDISLPNGTYKLYFDCGDTEGLIPAVAVAGSTVTEQNLDKTYQKLSVHKDGADGTADWVLTDNGCYEVQTSDQDVNAISMGYFETVEDFATTDFIIRTKVNHAASNGLLSGLAISGTMGEQTETAVFGFVNSSGNAVIYAMAKNAWMKAITITDTYDKLNYELTVVKKADTITCYINGAQYAQWNLNVDGYDFNTMTNVKIGFGIYRMFDVTFSDYSYTRTYSVSGSVDGVTSGSITATETTTGDVLTFTNALKEDGSYDISLPNGTYKLYFDCGDTEGLIPTVTVAGVAVAEQNLDKTYQKLSVHKEGADGTADWVLTDNGCYEVQTSDQDVNAISMGYFETVENFSTTDFIIHTKVEHAGVTSVLSGLAISGTMGEQTETAVFGFVNKSGNAAVYGMTINQWIGIQSVANNAENMSYKLTIVKKGDTITCYIDGVQCVQWNLTVDGCDFSSMTNVKIGFGVYRMHDVTFSDYSYSTDTDVIENFLSSN